MKTIGFPGIYMSPWSAVTMVTGYGRFPTTLAGADDDVSAHHYHFALSIYLETILFGLRSGKNWLDTLRQGGHTPCPPVPTSGKVVKIGNRELECLDLCGRAGGFASSHTQVPDEWTISQGGIFTGRLNVYESTKLVNLTKENYLPFSDVDEVVDVVVNVSSIAVHDYLTLPEHAWKAMQEIYAHFELIKHVNHQIEAATASCLDKQENYQSRLARGETSLAEAKLQELETVEAELAEMKEERKELIRKSPAISDVLLAAHSTQTGTVTVMANLSAAHFLPLLPSKNKVSLHMLWMGFLQLL